MRDTSRGNAKLKPCIAWLFIFQLLYVDSNTRVLFSELTPAGVKRCFMKSFIFILEAFAYFNQFLAFLFPNFSETNFSASLNKLQFMPHTLQLIDSFRFNGTFLE